MRTHLVLSLVLGLSAVSSLAQAQAHAFPSRYYPNGQHPRMWLTTERLAALKAGRAANSPQWQRFERNFAHYMDPSNEGWAQWEGYVGGVAPMALMYWLTGEQRYVDRGYYFATKAETKYQNGERYWIRDNFMLALGYDWFYSRLSPQQKQAFRTQLLALADNTWTDALAGGNSLVYTAIDTDRVTVGGLTQLMIGAALYGDSPRAQELLNRAWWLWERGNGSDTYSHPSQRPTPIQTWVRDATGGVYYTGLAYYMGTDVPGLSHWWTTLRTAFHYDANTIHPELRPFWANLIHSTIDQIDPPRQRLLPMGDWQDDNALAEQNWLHRYLTLISWEAEQAGDSRWAALGRGAAAMLPSRHSDSFNEFFFSYPPGDSSKPSSDPYRANLPKIRTTKGVDMLFFRDSWETRATWGAFSGQGGEPTDHQSEDTGAFTLYRQDDYLTKTATGYRDFLDASYVHNNLSIPNGLPNGSPRLQAGAQKAGLERHREHNEAPLFAYAMLQADGQWNLEPKQYTENAAKTSPVRTYRRHFFWAGDYVIVLDRLRTVNPIEIKYRLRAQSRPTLSGATISQLSANGHQKLLHRTMEPSRVTFDLMDEKAAWSKVEKYQIHDPERLWQYQIRPAATDKLNLLNVMQMGPSTMAGFDAMQSISSPANSGVRLGSWVVVFSAEENLRSSVNYAIAAPQAGLNHLVADLEPGTYQMVEGTRAPVSVTVGAQDNTAFFQTQCAQGPCEIRLTRQAASSPAPTKGEATPAAPKAPGAGPTGPLVAALGAMALTLTGLLRRKRVTKVEKQVALGQHTW